MLTFSRCRSGEEFQVVGRKGEKTMYTGTLIDELMKAVERSEKRSLQAQLQEEKLTYFYSIAQSELVRVESQLLGVA